MKLLWSSLALTFGLTLSVTTLAADTPAETVPEAVKNITAREEGTELSLSLEKNGSKRFVPCKLGTDFVVFPGGITPGEIEAPVVFAGYGRVDSERNIDDYKDLDVKDRFVLVYGGQSGAAANRTRGGGRRTRAMSTALGKRENAKKK